MPVKIIYRGEIYEAQAKLSVKEALIQIGRGPQFYPAVRDGRPITADQQLTPDRRIKQVAVVSGGGAPARPPAEPTV